jgi:hypothetical protein
MTEYSWAQGFVDPCLCHIRAVYPGGERSIYFERTCIFLAICGAWLGPVPVIVKPGKPLPPCRACELRVLPIATRQ